MHYEAAVNTSALICPKKPLMIYICRNVLLDLSLSTDRAEPLIETIVFFWVANIKNIKQHQVFPL